jgi:protein TonB
MEVTARVELRQRHTTFLAAGFALAALLHAVMFAFWPQYVPSVYRLPEVTIPVWVDIEPERVIPPVPKKTEPPEVPVAIAASDDVDDNETMPRTLLDYEDFLHRPPTPPAPPDSFRAFDTPPQLLASAEPVYPELARRAEVEGMVIVLVTIDEGGRVIDAEIASSDSAVFDQAALEAAYKFVFKPAYQRDIPVKARIAIRFRFSLTD